MSKHHSLSGQCLQRRQQGIETHVVRTWISPANSHEPTIYSRHPAYRIRTDCCIRPVKPFLSIGKVADRGSCANWSICVCIHSTVCSSTEIPWSTMGKGQWGANLLSVLVIKNNGVNQPVTRFCAHTTQSNPASSKSGHDDLVAEVPEAV